LVVPLVWQLDDFRSLPSSNVSRVLRLGSFWKTIFLRLGLTTGSTKSWRAQQIEKRSNDYANSRR
jgi:hypothetical protein